MTNHKFVFIGGLHRSATTLLARVLSQHPMISGASNTGVIEDEGQLLQTVYPTDMAHGGPGRFAFDPAAHLTEASPLATPEHARLLLEQWSAHWNLDKPLLLEKSPPNLIRSRFLQALFPASSFIFIIRHPVATSLATHKWSGTGIYSLVHHWVHAHELMRGDRDHLARSLVVTYEGLVSKPADTMLAIERFIAVPPHTYQLGLRSELNQKYNALWRERFLVSENRSRPVPTPRSFYGHASRWRNFNPKRKLKQYIRRNVFGEERQLSLTTWEAQDALSMFEPRVNNFGYSLTDFSRAPQSPFP